MLWQRYILKRHPVRKSTSQAAQDALDQLNAFLNAAEPEPVYWLTRLRRHGLPTRATRR